ncbi:alginate lyase family protein [Mycobacterium sp. pV006]|uniref:alginate lyase family protein n=1 Tax=Mycobacterium sp. pV006 TaxID=3238983 RepID=UPI00351B006E
MSPAEVAWRTERAVDTLLGRDGLRPRPDAELLVDAGADWTSLLDQFRDGLNRPVLLDRDRARRVAARHPEEVQRLLVEAEQLLAGRRTYLGYGPVDVGTSIDWNLDPHSGYRWPAVPGSRIDHRAAPSDPKWIWELNRLQHLPILAQAWLLSGEQRYADTATQQLDSWIDQNPVGIGIAWRGAFESGVRAASVAVALQGLRWSPTITPDRYRRLAHMLDASARYCWQARSRFSSANNHLIGEMSGLAVIHLLFPELVAPAELFDRALHILATEAERLILPDGAGAEQSIAYQIFTAELIATVVVLMRLGGVQPAAELPAALDRSAHYLAALVGPYDPDPRYGDDDDSFALRLGPEPKRTVRQHLGIVAAITGNGTAARLGENTLTAAWFAEATGTDLAYLATTAGVCGGAASHYATDGGLVVIRDGGRRLTMDVGPLGHLSTAAHGHADALAVTLSNDGRDLIVDPGTASFYGNPAVRSAYRGTRVHATVCVDDVDQSVPGGAFFWRRHARTTVHAVDLERGVVDAEHDGYRRLADPVRHRRWVIAPPDETTMVVVDLIGGRGRHDIVVGWPLHPDLESRPTTSGHLVSRDGAPVLSLCYGATAGFDVEQVRADDVSHLGWWSERLEDRTPAWMVGVRCRAVTPVAVISLLHTDVSGESLVPGIVRSGSTLTARWVTRCAERVLTIDTSRPGAVFDMHSSFLR